MSLYALRIVIHVSSYKSPIINMINTSNNNICITVY